VVHEPSEGPLAIFWDLLLGSDDRFDPHVIKPTFCLDSGNVCFQDLNHPSWGSKEAFVKVIKRVPPGMCLGLLQAKEMP
jgi:hypothetical protein